MERRKVFVLCCAVLCIISIGVAAAYGAVNKGLYSTLSKEDEVKVYVGDISDISETGKAAKDDLKKLLEGALTGRKSINFTVVNDVKDADIIINSEINEFMWTDEDPVDMITGVGPIVMDAMKKENYGRMNIEFSIIDAKSGKILWTDVEKATITDETMTEEESIDLLNERIVKVFMREAFSKSQSN
jgi:hypothetical protein